MEKPNRRNCCRYSNALLILTSMMHCGKWAGTLSFPGKAAVIQCPGSLPVEKMWVHEQSGDVEVHHGEQRIATHSKTAREHLTATQPEHHRGIPAEPEPNAKY